MKPNWKNKTVWTGDNLPIMRGMNSESVDLIYLDPPFNSKTDYAAPIGSKAAGAAFKDTWTLSDLDVEWINLIEEKHPALYRALLAAMNGSDKSYLAYMATRLLEMRRILKPTGSIYIHCDPTVSHYIKVMMDGIFVHQNFRNEIIWKRTGSHGGSNRWGPVHDTLLFYTKTEKYTWNRTFQAYDQDYLDRFYRFEDEKGRYHLVTLTGAGTRTGDSGSPWRRINPTDSGRHWAVPSRSLQAAYPTRDFSGLSTQEKLDLLDAAGLVYWPQKGSVPRQKRYSGENPGVNIQDVITDIGPVSSHAKERHGYPTQKPLALLERIIKASSNEGDIVLDPFCGCATTLAAADFLKRSWVGIDISPKAAELVVRRITAQQGLWRNIIHRTDIPNRTDIGKLPPYNSQANRHKLYGIQEGNCAGCKTHFEARHLEIDHIISRAKGGTDHIENLQLLCGNCNRIKGDRGMEYLKVKLQIGG